MSENLNKPPGQLTPNNMDYVAALHAENQRRHDDEDRRLSALEDRSDEILVSLAEIAANTKDLPELSKRVDALESDRDTDKATRKTALKMLGWAAAGLGAAVPWAWPHINWSVMLR